jgi:hypothetical protein
MLAFQADGPGSIPGRRTFLFVVIPELFSLICRNQEEYKVQVFENKKIKSEHLVVMKDLIV